MKANKTEHVFVGKRPKINNSILGIASIFAIFLIVFFVVKDMNRTNQVASLSNTLDASGQASEVLLADTQNTAFCKLIVGQTTLYDETVLAASLNVGASAYYSGYTVTVQEINSEGCLVDVNGNIGYLAIGQIQRVGPLYVTVKDVVQ